MRTNVLPTDPNKRMAYTLSVLNDSINESYWSRWMGAEGTPAIVIRKTDLESGPGDEVTTTLTAKLRGASCRKARSWPGQRNEDGLRDPQDAHQLASPGRELRHRDGRQAHGPNLRAWAACA
jgi:hypothetical protein